MKRQTPPDGIVITFPVQFLKDLSYTKYPEVVQIGIKTRIVYGLRELSRKMNDVISNPDSGYWIHSMNTRPTVDIEFVYITVLGRILWRGNCLGFEPGGEKKFEDGRKRTAKNWLLIGNIIPAPGEFRFKGTQGFRYTDKIF